MSTPPSRELALVELVSAAGDAIGSATVARAHAAAGLLHRAFSVLLFDREGRTLLQQRAATKTRFPLRWANTCCGHPTPGEAVVVAARRRMTEELGIRGVSLSQLGVYTYLAADPVTGRVEHEYDHVLVGEAGSDLAMTADPNEVAATRWISSTTLARDVTSDEFAPWLSGVLNIALPFAHT